MGNKQSSTSNSNTTTNVLNQTQINDFNKSVFDTAVNTMTKNLNSCSTSTTQNNTCGLNNAKIAGNLNITGTQSNTLASNFSCTNSSKTQSAMASEMMAKAAAEMQSAAASNLKAQLASQAAASSTTGALSTAIGNKSATNTNTNNNTNITNNTISNMVNSYEQKLQSNFTAETVNECIGKITQSNNRNINNVTVGGSADISCDQTNTLRQIQECKALADVIQETSQQVLQEFGVKVTAANTTEQVVVANSTSTNTATSTGVFQDIFSGIAGVIGSVSNPYSLLCFCIVIIGIFILVSGAMALKGEDANNMSSISSMIKKGGNKKNIKGGGDILSNTAIDLLTSILSSDSEYL